MIKRDELSNPHSCFNRANDDEELFVLRGRDIAAPATIRYWCQIRIMLGKNKADDHQIQEAMLRANHIEKLQSSPPPAA